MEKLVVDFNKCDQALNINYVSASTLCSYALVNIISSEGSYIVHILSYYSIL